MRKERKGLNVIDVVIILLLIALLGTAGYRIYTEVASGESNRQSNIIIVFEAQVEDGGIVNYLYDGAAIYFTSDNSQLGNLLDRNAEDGLGPVYEVECGEDGAVTLCGTLCLVADAYKAQDGEYYIIDDRNITVGSRIDVYTDTAVMQITVKAIEAAVD